MSRTAIKGFGLFVTGKIVAIVSLVLLFSLFAQNVSAQLPIITPQNVYQINDGATDRRGLVIGIDPGTMGFWTYQDASGTNNPLTLAGFRETGAIYVANTSSLTFLNGTSLTDGGAINIIGEESTYIFAGMFPAWVSPTANSAGTFLFQGNTATNRGGAIYSAPRSNLTLSVLNFVNNTSLGTTGQSGGGAIYNDQGVFSLNSVRFTANRAEMSGGAIYNLLGTMTFNVANEAGGYNPATWGGAQNLFSGNVATQQHGGAIYNNSGTLTFNASATNTALNDTGTWTANATTPWSWSVTGGGTRNAENTFINNQALNGSGGAIYSNAGSMTFTAATTPNSGNNSITLNANAATDYFYFYTFSHETTATGGRFSNNVAGNYGGAIFSSGTLAFQATANAASATASATANATVAGTSPWAEVYTPTTSNAGGGVFADNRAGLEGGAIHFTGTTLSFTANALSATATANATATATPGTNNTGWATAHALAFADAISTGGSFARNFAGTNDGTGNFSGIGGAIYARNATLNFTATAQAAVANATANPTATRAGTGSAYAGANATAYAYSQAYGAQFTDNRARLGGAIYNDGGTITFRATITPAAGQNASSRAISTPTATGSAPAYANTPGFFTFLLHTPDSGATSTLSSLQFQNPLNPLFSSFPYNYGARAYSESTAYGAVFMDNKANASGGAIYNDGGTLRFISTSPTSTSAYSQGATDGGTPNETHTDANRIYQVTRGARETNDWPLATQSAYRYSWSVAVADVAAALFEGNIARLHGGAIYTTSRGSNLGAVEIVGTTRFHDNWAGRWDNVAGDVINYVGGGDGGAIYNEGQTLNLMATTAGTGTAAYSTGYSVFTSNVAQRGGAIFNDDGVLNIHNTSTGSGDNYMGELTRNVNLVGAMFGDPELGRTALGNRAVFGGALYNTEGGEMNLDNVQFGNNVATDTISGITVTGGGLGGAIYNAGGIVNLFGGKFRDNQAVSGGAIYHTNSNNNSNALLNIDSSGFAGGISFEANKASQFGGAIYNDDLVGVLNLATIVFNANEAGGAGGAIWNAGTVTLTNASFAANRNTTGTVGGGAIFNTAIGRTALTPNAGVMTFVNTSFTGNSAGTGGAPLTGGSGGAIYNEGGNLSFSGTTNFTNNRAGDFGGAIYNRAGEVELVGGNFGVSTGASASGNTAGAGGAIYNEEGHLILTDVNFWGNQATNASGGGGAVYSWGHTSGATIDLNVTDGATSTFRGNTAASNAVGGGAESIFFVGSENVLNVNVGTGGILYMYDPMRGTGHVDIVQEGLGRWQLSGRNNFTLSGGSANFEVREGTLYFHARNYGGSDAATANYMHTELLLGSGNFMLANETTLIVDGAVRNPVPGGSPDGTMGGLVQSGSVINASRIDLLGTLVLNLTEADLGRTRGELLDGSIDSSHAQATLTLNAGTINVGTATSALNVDVYLTGSNIDGVLGQTWFQWFADDNDGAGNIGDNGIFVIGASGATYNIDSNVVVSQWNSALNGGLGGWERHSTIRTYNAVSETLEGFGFVVDSGMLKLGSVDAYQWTLDWAGVESGTTDGIANGSIWNVGTLANWHRESGGDPERFYHRDHVRFGDSYLDENGVSQTVAAARRTVNIAENVEVSTMNVTNTGARYTFNLMPGMTLAATAHGTGDATGGSIDFHNAMVNVFSNGMAASTTTISASGAGNSITFGDGSVLNFNLVAGVSDEYKSNTAAGGNPILRLTTGNLIVHPTSVHPTNGFVGFVNIAHTPSVFVNTANLAVGQRLTFIEAAGQSSALENMRRGIYVNGQGYIARRSSNGVVHRFIVEGDRLNLVGYATPVGGYNLYWTGQGGGVWDNVSESWLGHYTGSAPPNHYDPLAFTFSNGDQVTFADSYLTESGMTQNVFNRNVAINGNVDVFSMDVVGSNYRFTLGDNVVLSSMTGIGFGSSVVVMGEGARITANDNVEFGNLFTGAATIHVSHGAEIVAPTIRFTGDSDFRFDMSSVGVGSLLTLRGHVSVMSEIGAVGGGNIYLSSLPGLAAGESISLIKIEGTGTVTPTGTLMIGNSAYAQIRGNSTGVMLGLKSASNNQELLLWGADAHAQAILHWTGVNNPSGVDNSVWSAVQTNTNWSGQTTEEVGVHSFLNGDRVIFGDAAHGVLVDNRDVNVASGGVTVADMTVTGRGYTFDLRQGGIIADATHARAGTLSNPTGNINFGRETTIRSGVGSVVTARGTNGANGTIAFGRDTRFSFDLSGANTVNPLLTLNGNVDVTDSGRIGSGDIFVSNLSTAGRSAGDSIILVNAGVNNAGVTTNTGDLYRVSAAAAVLHSPTRSTASNAAPMFGLAINNDASQLLLKWVDAAGLSDNLGWAGRETETMTVRDGSRTYDLYVWGVADETRRFAHWQGLVDGVNVNTFLNGDTVRFAELDGTGVANRKYVVVNEGGVRVGSMFVDVSGYTFDLMGGGGLKQVVSQLADRRTYNSIVASGRVDLRDSTIMVGIDYDSIFERLTFGQIIAQDDITVDGATVRAAVLMRDADFAEMIRVEHGGVLDLDILVSEGGAIVNNGDGVDVNMVVASPYYDATFVIDNTSEGGRGLLRLSYFRYENRAKSLGLSHNMTEASKALDILRHIWTEDEDVARLDWIAGNNRGIAGMDILRGTELVANSLSMAMWRPWEMTHQRTRNVREESGWNSWGGSYYRFGNTSSDGNARKFDLYRGGAMLGVDYGSNKYWQFGGTFGYGLPKMQGHYGTINADDLTLGFYSKVNYFEQAWVSSFIGYGHQNYKMTRYGLPGDVHESKYSGDALYASVEFVRPITVSILTVMPLVALDHQTAWTKGFTESGYWGQTVEGTNMDRTMVRFGVDSKIVGIGGGNLRVDLATRLQAAFLVDGDKKAKVVSHFPMSGASMTLHGVNMGWGQVNAGLTTSGEFRERYQWFFDVDGFLTERTTALQGQIGVSTRF